MIRAFLLTMALCAATAHAGERAVLDGVANRAVISVHGTEAAAALRPVDGGFEMSIRFTAPSGYGFVSRIMLVDGQNHDVVLEADDDLAPDLRFSFHRIGDAVEMTGAATDRTFVAQH